MKVLFLCFFSCFCVQVNAQKIILDNWNGDTNQFKLFNEGIRLDGDESPTILNKHLDKTFDCGQLSLNLGLDFAPSSNNRFSLFLAKDSFKTEGLEIRIGTNGANDAVEIRDLKTGVKQQELLVGKVALGFDSLKLSIEFAESIIVKAVLGVEYESSIPIAVHEINYIVMQCSYTSTRADKFYLHAYEEDLNQACVVDVAHELNFGDVVISELMIDPTPQRLLPEREYIELFNTTDTVINLQSLYFSMDDKEYPLPVFELQPKNVAVLSEELYSGWLQADDLPSLNNDKFEIELRDENHHLIHAFQYNSKIYKGLNGGVSLELYDVNNHCLPTSYKASTAFEGGTPLKINFSIERTITKPRILERTPLTIFWDQPILIGENISYSTTYDNYEVSEIFCNGAIFDTTFKASENKLHSSIRFTEVLTNPVDSCPEFIELMIEESGVLQQLFLDVDGRLFKLKDSLVTGDEGIVVLTPNYHNLLKCYEDVPHNVTILEVAFGNLNSTYQQLKLFDDEGVCVAAVILKEAMHHDLIAIEKGMSLELQADGDWSTAVADKGASPGVHTVRGFNSKEMKLLDEELIYQLSEGSIKLHLGLIDTDALLSVSLYSKQGLLKEQVLSDYRVLENELVLTFQTSRLGFYLLYLEWNHPSKGVTQEVKPIVIKE